jgi:uncharacterized delta-60 repeat protein
MWNPLVLGASPFRLLTLLPLLLVPAAAARTDAQVWVVLYNGAANGDDVARDIASDGAGNVYVTGYSAGDGTDMDFVTIKYSPAGEELWVRFYDGPSSGEDIAVTLGLDAVGNVFVAGYSQGDGTGYDFATIKYDSSGVQQWVCRYNGPDGDASDKATALAVDETGSVCVTGTSDAHWATVRYSPQGDELWVRRFEHYGSNEPRAITVDGEESVYVTGTVWGSVNTDFMTIKYDSTGAPRWEQQHGHGDITISDGANDIIIDPVGASVYVTGWGGGPSAQIDFITIRYNAISGAQQWLKSYHAPNSTWNSSQAMAWDNQGNIIIAGSSSPPYDYTTLSYNTSGTMRWVQQYSGPVGVDHARDLAVDGEGNAYVTGNSLGDGTGDDIATLMYDTDGSQVWESRYNGPGNGADQPRAITVDPEGNVYMTGYCLGISSGLDIVTILYDQETGIPDSGNPPPATSLWSPVPNPSSGPVRVFFELPATETVDLAVYDLAGRRVITLVSEAVPAGSNQAVWDPGEAPPGCYLMVLRTEEETLTRTCVLIE